MRDSLTMFRRQLLHMRRYPSLTIMLLAQPVLFLLLFVYVLGGSLGASLGGGRSQYLIYIVPAILVIAVASVALGTAVSIATDMTGGVIARFRTMAIARASVLTGHVLGAMAQTALAVAVSALVAVALGYRSSAGVPDWLVTVCVLGAFGFALTWLTVALGLAADSVETASNTPMFLVFLPFLGSGFVPTDSMPAGLRWFAEYQPFTPVMEAVRGSLAGAVEASDVWLALGWSTGIAALGYLWARRLYRSRVVG
ncbi:ABC transporter permease [Spongisporangium articulatum]|uniref:Transport permease protein n=1 Tax=Spongisporangium articulatum TaxID=3362603 RepID=A0ABW8AM94_9ACTN